MAPEALLSTSTETSPIFHTLIQLPLNMDHAFQCEASEAGGAEAGRLGVTNPGKLLGDGHLR